MTTELELGGEEIKRGRGRPPLHRDDAVKAVEPVKEERVKIILEEKDEIPPTGQFFGINGTGYILRPGEIAEVPMSLVNLLDDLVELKTETDPVTKQPMAPRPRHRFSYRIVK